MQEQIKVLTEQIRRQVLERILKSQCSDKLWLKGKPDRENCQSGLVFYVAKDERQEVMAELKALFRKEEMNSPKLPISVEKKNRIYLEFTEDKYRIPFYLEAESYKEVMLYPIEENFDNLTYYRFPTEEYIARGFYKILDKLELLNDLSWYKEIYDILIAESVDGKRVRESFSNLLETRPMPSFEKRLDTIKSYENYGYMKKKWKNEKKRYAGELPEWNQVILLLVTFFSPIYKAIIRDEVFFEDWMPQLRRYL